MSCRQALGLRGFVALVLSIPKAYRIGFASLGSAMLQTGLMTVITSHLTRSYGISPQEAALFILAAMSANLAGALVVVLTRIQQVASTALLSTAAVAAVAGVCDVECVARYWWRGRL